MKKAVSLLLSLILILTTAHVSSFAAEFTLPEADIVVECGEDAAETGYETDIMVVNGHTYNVMESVEGSESVSPFTEAPSLNAATYDGSMYNQLTKRQKACYAALENTTYEKIRAGTRTNRNGKTYYSVSYSSIAGVTGTVMTGYFDNGYFYPTGAGVKTEKEVYTDLCAAIEALRYDRPDILWLRSMVYGYEAYQKDSKSLPKIRSVTYAFLLDYKGQEPDMMEAADNSAKKIAQAATEAGADTYSKVKYVHDLLCSGNVYGDTEALLSHTAYSALLSGEGLDPVCEGYAKAFKLVMDKLNIPTCIVSSADHMWNVVYMDDGEWYAVDCTWDDNEDIGILYDYFLIGSKTVVGGVEFDKESDHIELNPFEGDYQQNPTTLNMVKLTYPKKYPTAYVYIGHDYPPLTFTDVKRSAYYYDAVEWAVDKNITSGQGDGLFGSDKSCTRADAVTFLWRAAGRPEPETTENPFKDVKEGEYYYKAVLWAVENKITAGTSPNTFDPKAVCRRSDIVSFMYRAAGRPEVSETSNFKDVKKSDYFSKPVSWAVENGITSGTAPTTFSPNDVCRRNQIVSFLYRGRDITEPEEEEPEEEPETPEEEIPEAPEEEGPESPEEGETEGE